MEFLFSGLHVLLPKESESVLLGSAILAKAAADRKEVSLLIEL